MGTDLLGQFIAASILPSPWRVGNEVLYELCRTKPAHTDEAEVISKIWLIGRCYAAAIESRKTNLDENNDSFYLTSVAPGIIGSAIDEWLAQAWQYASPSTQSWSTLVQVHHRTTQLFKTISGLDKRSLASKYLDFHVPHLFYIYDSKAVEAISRIRGLVGRSDRSVLDADDEYQKFAAKCLALQQLIEDQYGIGMSPRDLDNLLLQVTEEKIDLSLCVNVVHRLAGQQN